MVDFVKPLVGRDPKSGKRLITLHCYACARVLTDLTCGMELKFRPQVPSTWRACFFCGAYCLELTLGRWKLAETGVLPPVVLTGKVYPHWVLLGVKNGSVVAVTS